MRAQMWALRALAAVSVLLMSSGVAAQTVTAEDVVACIRGNFPKTTTEQTVEFTTIDRTGYKKVSRARIQGKRMDDGNRRVVTRFTRPLDVRGSAFLMVENSDLHNEMWVYNPELRNTRRLSAQGTMGNLFGTDFSYEDFERYQGLNRPGDHSLLGESSVADRPVWVLETRPAKAAGSSYSRILSYIDQETCVTLRSESFEGTREEPRKVLVADPEQVQESGGVWICTDVVMRDHLDNTETRLLVEDLRVNADIDDRCFLHSQLGRRGC